MADDDLSPDGLPMPDILWRLRGHLRVINCRGCMICMAADEIERLRAELRDLRKTSSRALWDARNIASALMLALEWHRKSPMLKGTQADQRRYAVDTYDTWQKDWNQVDHAITPPGWMR